MLERFGGDRQLRGAEDDDARQLAGTAAIP
jgi:hypothetical protein